VTAGQPIGAIHFLERPDRTPTIIEAPSSGVVIAHRGPTVTQQGDIAFCLAHDVPDQIIDTFTSVKVEN
jgi:N-alpha-acetyl-L-2,4-diaminobutyrate deacetylase